MPFTLLVFRMIGQEERVLRLVVLETIAANLGSMATPIGNPQNLYLFSISGLSAGAFLRAVVPYAAMALVMLLGALLLQRSAAIDHEDLPAPTAADRPPLSAMAPFLALLVLCLLVVFRVLPYAPVLVIVAAAVLAVDRRLFRAVDYFLLLTFLCFFIFIAISSGCPPSTTSSSTWSGAMSCWRASPPARSSAMCRRPSCWRGSPRTSPPSSPA